MGIRVVKGIICTLANALTACLAEFAKDSQIRTEKTPLASPISWLVCRQTTN